MADFQILLVGLEHMTRDEWGLLNGFVDHIKWSFVLPLGFRPRLLWKQPMLSVLVWILAWEEASEHSDCVPLEAKLNFQHVYQIEVEMVGGKGHVNVIVQFFMDIPPLSLQRDFLCVSFLLFAQKSTLLCEGKNVFQSVSSSLTVSINMKARLSL